MVQKPESIEQIYDILIKRIKDKDQKTIMELNGFQMKQLEIEMKHFS